MFLLEYFKTIREYEKIRKLCMEYDMQNILWKVLLYKLKNK